MDEPIHFNETFRRIRRKQGWRGMLFCLFFVSPGSAKMLFWAADNLEKKLVWQAWSCLILGLLEFPATFFSVVLLDTLFECRATLMRRCRNALPLTSRTRPAELPGINYGRGLTRIYLLLSVIWISWGLYKPTFDKHESIKSTQDFADTQLGECQEGASRSIRKSDECFQRAREAMDTQERLNKPVDNAQWEGCIPERTEAYREEMNADYNW